MVDNRQVRLRQRPEGEIRASDWEHVTSPAPEPGDGEFLVRVEYISLDPAMRGWMNEARSYIAPVALGAVMRAGGLGRVVTSRHPDFPEGAYVSGMFGVQEYALSAGRDVTVVDPALAPLPTYLGVLGMTGLTAYFGLLDVGRPKAGETVLVSGAAGAVGAVVGQLARHHGCRVVGIAGGAEKCRQLTEDLGFDAAIDYRSGEVGKGLKEHCPDGVDVYFDNVGGEILDQALARLRLGARVVICGAISQYNATEPPRGPANYLSLLVNRASMTGMLVFDYKDRYAEGVRALAGLLAEGAVTAREDVVDGTVDDFPATLNRLFTGENNGKLILRVG